MAIDTGETTEVADPLNGLPAGDRHNEQITALRRRHVAALRLRGMTLTEIVRMLGDLGVRNPETQAPFGKTTVYNDLKWLEKNWQDEAVEFHDRHKANILAELREMRRAAWQEKKYSVVLRGIRLEADLFGLFAPIQVDRPSARAGTVIDAETWTRIANDMSIDELESALVLRDRIAEHTKRADDDGPRPRLGHDGDGSA